MADDFETFEPDDAEGVGAVGLVGLRDFLNAMTAPGDVLSMTIGCGESDGGEGIVFLRTRGVDFVLPVAAARGLAEIAEDGARHDERQDVDAIRAFARAVRQACERAEEAGSDAG